MIQNAYILLDEKTNQGNHFLVITLMAIIFIVILQKGLSLLSIVGIVTSFSGMNAYAATGVCYLTGLLVIICGALVFSLITGYNDLHEIQKGNVAVSLATGGLVLGLANVLRFAILSNSSFTGVLLWGAIGVAGMLIGWLVFDLVTPQFRTDDELKKDNRAVGAIVFASFLAISFIVGASIS